MNWSNIWPWHWVRANKALSRRVASHARLAVEILEDRVVPSSSSSNDALYQLWRHQTFHVDDVKVANLPSTAAVAAQTAVPTNASFGSQIGLPSVFANTTYRGNGYSVAVIDTGIDYLDPSLGGGFGPGHKVIAGYNFVNNTADPMDDNGHGTVVAGEIGSSDSTYSGVAPNVNLIALKVLDSTGSGTFGNVQNALDWVVANQAKYHIVAINLSLGSGNYTVNPYTFLDSEFTALKNDGVFMSIAAGNSFYTNNSALGLDYPAVDPLVVSVGAVYDGNFGSLAWASGARDYTTGVDHIASFSQRGPALSIMAPGALITSTYLNNTFQSMAGTSMAAPVIAGSAVLIHQEMDALHLTANEDTILSVMQRTGVTLVDGKLESDNVTNTGLTFKRIDLSAAIASLGTSADTGPTVQPINNQQVAAGGSLQLTLSASDPDGDAITFSASVLNSSAAQAYQLQQRLGVQYPGSYYTNTWGQNEKWMTSASGWYCILPNGELRHWAGSIATTLQSANLTATLDPKFYADPSLLWNAQATTTTNPTLSISGNRLTITAPAGAAGSLQIQVGASDGSLSATQTFTLTIRAYSAPVLQAIANQKAAPGGSVTVTLSASDPDGDPITYSASLLQSSSAAQAYQLQQQLGLQHPGSYYTNSWGQNEKWMTSTSGWYCILPNGELRRWAGSITTTLQAANLIATLDPRIYADPSLLWNAQAASTAIPTLAINGNQLTIQAPAGLSGTFQIQVGASDGQQSATQTFTLSIQANTALVLQAIGSQKVAPSGSVTVSLNASDPAGAAVTFSASVLSSSAAEAYQLQQQLGLKYPGSYYTNIWGQNEKWMSSANGWYCILPNGELRRWTGSIATTMQAANLVATLDPRCYADPSLLWNAQATSTASPILTINGNQLTIQAPAGLWGTLQIQVGASNGKQSATQTFTLTIAV
jgi:subtilisin family serine protease